MTGSITMNDFNCVENESVYLQGFQKRKGSKKKFLKAKHTVRYATLTLEVFWLCTDGQTSRASTNFIPIERPSFGCCIRIILSGSYADHMLISEIPTSIVGWTHHKLTLSFPSHEIYHRRLKSLYFCTHQISGTGLA